MLWNYTATMIPQPRKQPCGFYSIKMASWVGRKKLGKKRFIISYANELNTFLFSMQDPEILWEVAGCLSQLS